MSAILPAPDLGDVAGVLLWFVALSVALTGLWLYVLVRFLRRLTVDRDATQLDALRRAPLALVLTIDAIDLGFDFLGAPLVWAIMSRSELRSLRGLSLLESLVPGTQLVPVMTLSWLFARSRAGGGGGPLAVEGREVVEGTARVVEREAGAGGVLEAPGGGDRPA